MILRKRFRQYCVLAVCCGIGFLQGCTEPAPPPTVAETLSQARAPDGQYLSWVEHLIDAEDVNGGVPIRGGDGLALGDLDGDGFEDIVTAQEDSNHIRIAFGTGDPDRWVLMTLAEGNLAGAVEDVALGDLNGDGWLDIVAACEDAHLAYFENPGIDHRAAPWPALIPGIAKGRGSWLRVFVADINGDGQLDLTAANKGAPDIVRPDAGDPDNGATSLITFSGPPLESAAWQEQVLFQEGIPNNAMPLDIDGDGDLDVLAAKRVRNQLVLIENLGVGEGGALRTLAHSLLLAPAFEAPEDWQGLANAFQAEAADLNGDGRLDLVVNVIERTPAQTALTAGLAWLEQPESLDAPWRVHRIGSTLPDWVIGIHLADLDGDGDLDAVTGGYSGLNILKGSYSGASRDFDQPEVDETATVGRIAWFQNPGDPTQPWQRHDIDRRVRGMIDLFASRDLDGDGDLDLIAPRGNSGAFDGLVWFEQVRSEGPRRAFTPARAEESRPLPLPPADWQARYGAGESYVAPNKVAQEKDVDEAR